MISFAIAVTAAVATATTNCCHIRSSHPFKYSYTVATRDSIYIMSSVFLHTKTAHTLRGMNFTKMIGSSFSFVVRYWLLLSRVYPFYFISGRLKNQVVLLHPLTKFHVFRHSVKVAAVVSSTYHPMFHSLLH